MDCGRTSVVQAQAVPLKILLVDGDLPASRDEARCLRAAGHAVSVVAAARHAAWRLELSSPDLVLLHLRSADPDGFPLARQLQDTGLPFVLLIGPGLAQGLRALPTGALDYLVRPVDPEWLASRVGELMPPMTPADQ